MRPILRIFVKAVKPGGSSEPNFLFCFEEFLSNFCPSSLVLATHNLVCARPGCRVPLGRACSIPSFFGPMRGHAISLPFEHVCGNSTVVSRHKSIFTPLLSLFFALFPCPSTQLVVAMGVFRFPISILLK